MIEIDQLILQAFVGKRAKEVILKLDHFVTE